MPLFPPAKRCAIESYPMVQMHSFQMGITSKKRKTKPAKQDNSPHFFSQIPFPYSKVDSYISSLIPFAPTTPIKQARYIQSFKTKPMFQADVWSDQTVSDLRKALYTLNGVRWVLRRFLHKIRSMQLLPRNEADIVSGEAPKYPTYIVDWHGRQSWVYEASTLMMDLTKRLTHHDCFFEDVQAPRNPFTNLPLTLAQKISAWNQLSRYPIAQSTAFTAFRSSRYNLLTFVLEHKQFILLHALRQSMRVRGDYEVDERLIDFIRYCYDAEAVDCPLSMYKDLLKHFSENTILLQWRNLCTQYYTLDILYPHMNEKHIVGRERILDRTIPLIAQHQTLHTLWQANRNLHIE